MQKSIKDLGKLKRSLSVELPFEEVKPVYDRVWHRLKAVPMKGFRPGKQPKGWMEKHFKDQMAREAMNHVVPRYYRQAVEELQIDPATQPALENLEFDRKAPLQFEVTFELKPQLELPEYDKLKLEKQDSAVNDEQIDDYIERIRRSQAKLEERAEGEAAQENDIVTVDYEATIDGSEFNGSSNKDYVLEAGVARDPLLGSQVLEMKVGESKKFEHTFAENSSEEVAGKTAQVSVTMKKIKKASLPEINEEFLKQFSPEDPSVETFRKTVVEVLENMKKQEIQGKQFESLTRQLDELYGSFDLPESIVSGLIDDHTKKVKEQKPEISEEDLKADLDGYTEKLKTQLRVEYILDTVAKLESLTPDQHLVANNFTRYAQALQKDPVELANDPSGSVLYERASQEAMKDTALQFLVDKVLGPEEPSPSSDLPQDTSEQATEEA